MKLPESGHQRGVELRWKKRIVRRRAGATIFHPASHGWWSFLAKPSFTQTTAIRTACRQWTDVRNDSLLSGILTRERTGYLTGVLR